MIRVVALNFDWCVCFDIAWLVLIALRVLCFCLGWGVVACFEYLCTVFLNDAVR